MSERENKITKTKELCTELKKIVEEIEENIVSDPQSLISTNYRTTINSHVPIAGVQGSIIDNSYYSWTNSLRN